MQCNVLAKVVFTRELDVKGARHHPCTHCTTQTCPQTSVEARFHEDVDRLFCAKLDPLANDVHELTDTKVGRHEELILVDFGNITPIVEQCFENALQTVCSTVQNLRLGA